MQPFEPILYQQMFNFCTFILGGQFLLPQRANNEKREFSQLQKWARQKSLGAWGVQNGPFPATLARILPKILHHLDLYTGAPFSYYPRGQKRDKKSKDANSTQCSQAVSHPSTNQAQHCLTSVIGRELVHSMWYEKRVKWARVDGQAALLWG